LDEGHSHFRFIQVDAAEVGLPNMTVRSHVSCFLILFKSCGNIQRRWCTARSVHAVSSLFFLVPGKLTKFLRSGKNAVSKDGDVTIYSGNVMEIDVSQNLTKTKVNCHQHRTFRKCSQQAFKALSAQLEGWLGENAHASPWTVYTSLLAAESSRALGSSEELSGDIFEDNFDEQSSRNSIKA
jgi:hypothetical protein